MDRGRWCFHCGVFPLEPEKDKCDVCPLCGKLFGSKPEGWVAEEIPVVPDIEGKVRQVDLFEKC